MEYAQWRGVVDGILERNGSSFRCENVDPAFLTSLFEKQTSPFEAAQLITRNQLSKGEVSEISGIPRSLKVVNFLALSQLRMYFLVAGWTVIGLTFFRCFILAVIALEMLGRNSEKEQYFPTAVIESLALTAVLGPLLGCLMLLIAHMIPVWLGIYRGVSEPGNRDAASS